MPDLPIHRMVLYKHGVGYFERRGQLSGESLRLSFPREAMDDVLKSLVVLDLGSGQVHGVDFETPEDRATQLDRGSIHLSDARSLLDLLRDLRGREVRLTLAARAREAAAAAEGEPVEGLVIGVDIDEDQPLRDPLVSIYQSAERRVRAVPVRRVARLELLDGRAAEDLDYFLRVAQSEEDRRTATVRLSPGEHDLLIGYVAPAPAWRVSYRLLAEPAGAAEPAAGSGQAPGAGQTAAADGTCAILLQGWGLFDNQLDEDLERVELTLVAGMPVSFRYRLYEPHTPERPLVQDEERTVDAPIAFDDILGSSFRDMPAPAPAMAPSLFAGAAPPPMEPEERARGISRKTAHLSVDQVSDSVAQSASGEERGALFQYRVTSPVSVGRGQSAMAPIVSQRVDGRKELLYNGQKFPAHPVASLRLRNTTGLTLERGPVTVLEVGDYAGEAVLPFTRSGAELIVPYAVELGVKIKESSAGEAQTSSINVHQGYLQFQEWEILRRTYLLRSTLAAPVDVLVEQQLLDGYELFETPAPAEQSQGMARWSVTCPPDSEVSLVIQQRVLRTRQEYIRNIDYRRLRDLLKEGFLEQHVYGRLMAVLTFSSSIEQRQRRLRDIEQERKKIYERQRQVQGNLTPLGASDQEVALRSRYVTLLDELEDKLNALGAEEQNVRADIDKLEGQINEAIQNASS
jgi:hypothetical protein